MAKTPGQNGGKGKRPSRKKSAKKAKKTKSKSKPPKAEKPSLRPEDLPDESWERLPGEPSHWYSRFEKFRDKGPERRLLQVYRQHLREAGKYDKAATAKVPGAWYDQSKLWHWRMRAEQYDAENRKKRNERNERVLAELEEAQIKFGFEGVKKCNSMLAWPLADQTVNNDGKEVNIKAAGWSFGTIPKLMAISTMQIREAIGAVVSGPGRQQAADSEKLQPGDEDFISDEEITWLFHEYMDAPPEPAGDPK